MKDELEKKIEQADIILIGIGEEFEVKQEWLKDFPPYQIWTEKRQREPGAGEWILPFLVSAYCEQWKDERKDKLLDCYKQLHKIIGNRPHFVLTLNTDDLIYQSKIDPLNIVAPCGSLSRLQTKDEVWDGREERERIITQLMQESIALSQIPTPRSNTGEEAVHNVVSNKPYNEAGYREQWEAYQRWLTCTLNKNLCLLELGVGFQYPTVIRLPFEKIAFFNLKSSFIRVNSSVPQLSQGLQERGISLQESPVDFLLENNW